MAADLEGLGEEVRQRVQAMNGVTLEWEIKRLGVPGTASLGATSPLPEQDGPAMGGAPRHSATRMLADKPGPTPSLISARGEQ